MAEKKNDLLNELKEEFKGLGARVSRMFEDMGSGEGGEWNIRVDVCETGDAYVLYADIPGLTKEDVKLQVLDNNLLLSGERKALSGIGDTQWHRKERGMGAFKRSFTIPSGISLDSIKAKFENGVLTVTFAKEAATKGNGDVTID